MLENYIFSDSLRYEAHRLLYRPANDSPVEIGGMPGAAIVAALLVDTPEGDARGIAVDGDTQREQFFLRYEREVRRENGGLFITEVQALNEAYMELNGEDELLYAICGNDRLYDLAFGLMMDYMHRLVREQVGEQVYTVVPWKMPFAQWLFDAGLVETRRQQLLAIDWSDPVAVYTFARQLEKSDEIGTIEPTFVFEGLRADQVLHGYWEWLWETAQQEANLYPDGKVQLAYMKQRIRDNETDYDFLKPEMKHFTPSQLNLFRKWMTQWKEFVEKQIPPVVIRKTSIQQELFMDACLPAPPENNYVAVREYIAERKNYDEKFRQFCNAHKRTELCHQLSLMFGWVVSDNALGKSMRRQLKHPKKNHLL